MARYVEHPACYQYHYLQYSIQSDPLHNAAILIILLACEHGVSAGCRAQDKGALGAQINLDKFQLNRFSVAPFHLFYSFPRPNMSVETEIPCL